MNFKINSDPNKVELHNLFERSFAEILNDDTGYFTDELNQDKLSEWFDFDEMIKSLPNGKLVEVRDKTNQLIGAGFIAKQNPINWPDGHKAELFIIGVLPGHEKLGIGSQILQKCEEQAKLLGAEKILINAHSMQPQLHHFYQKNGYEIIGTLKNYYANGDAIFFSKNL